MKAIFFPPKEPYTGNLVWRKKDFSERRADILRSLDNLRNQGYFASVFPEGDGITFTESTGNKSDEEMLSDISACFDWATVQRAESNDSNEELAKLEDTAVLKCIVIVPLEKIFIEKTFILGDYQFCSRKACDTEPHERLGSYDCEYLQFETDIAYKDLLRINKTIHHNDVVIEKCLSLAECALDIIRFQFSSFKKRECTPNPAGQLESGFYAVEIIPLGTTHLKPLTLNGISRHVSVYNNWLGPEATDCSTRGRELLIAINRGKSDELSIAVKYALRSCRQSFYSPGNESRFLNLIFALDGLVDAGGLKGLDHRKYIAALLSGKNAEKFGKILIRYDHLYTDVRNKLVHKGMNFYQLKDDPDDACETIYQYIKDVIVLIEKEEFSSIAAIKIYAQSLLQSQSFIEISNNAFKARN